MLVVINISLNLLIRTWIYTNNFIMKRIVWLFIDIYIYIYFVSNNGLLKLKNMDWLSNWNITKWKKLLLELHI